MITPEIRRLVNLMNTADWREVYVPLIQKISENHIAFLRDPSQARKDARPGNYLRGVLDVCDLLLRVPKQTADSAIKEWEEEMVQKLGLDGDILFDSAATTAASEEL